jgi:two-component system response regulator AtoC
MTATILIVDDEERARQHIVSFLSSKGYETHGLATLGEAREWVRRGGADIIVLDVRLPDGYGPALLEETSHLPVRPPIILITAYGEVEMAVEAMKSGAHDFLQKPIKLADLEKSVQRAEELVAMRRELAHLRAAQHAGLDFVVGQTQEMQEVLNQAQRAAAACVSVLITGETGTGKEMLAKAIHQMGPRARKPFIGVDSANLPGPMLESELFGHDPGAYTSADQRKLGLMEIADGGILFLDEIASMPLEVQAKLLRALEERAFRRMGGTTLIKVDVQLLVASNRDLVEMMEQNTFRRDLYYRLKVVNLHLPPLRQRLEDIPELVGRFIRLNNQRMGQNISEISPRAMQALMAYRWPGNIRELYHVIERAMLFCDDPVIDLPHLPPEITGHQQ